MKRTYRFVQPSGFVAVKGASGEPVKLPVVAGIFKHPTVEQLALLLEDPAVARKYTVEALRRAPWSALRHFPRTWLLAHLPEATLTDGRQRAMEIVFGAPARTPH